MRGEGAVGCVEGAVGCEGGTWYVVTWQHAQHEGSMQRVQKAELQGEVAGSDVVREVASKAGGIVQGEA